MRHCILGALLWLFTAAATAADAYWLKFEESGYDDIVPSDNQPPSRILRSMEFLVRPDQRFSVRAQTGGVESAYAGTLEVRGAAFMLTLSPDPDNPLDAVNSLQNDPRMLRLQEKIAELDEVLQHQRSVAKDPDADPQVQRSRQRLEATRQAAEQYRQERRQLAPDDDSIEVQLEVDKPKVITSLSGEALRAGGKSRKFNRTTTVALRRAANLAAGEAPMPQGRAQPARTVPVRVFLNPSVRELWRSSIDKGMMFDAIEHQQRIQKHLRDQRQLPTTIERGEFQPPSPLRELFPKPMRD
jgi:hypothetical protein